MKEHYTLICDANAEGDAGHPIMVYKANVMGDVPFELIEYIGERFGRSLFLGERIAASNYDPYDFDALMYAIRYHKGQWVTHVDVYIHAILRRPFTKKQEERYLQIFDLDLNKRPYYPYDSVYSDVIRKL